jgi:DNA repair protein RadC
MDRIIRGQDQAVTLFATLAGEGCEVLAFAYLDRDARLLGMRHTRSPHRDWAALPIRDVAADALALGAAGVVMAHNHPAGDPRPSEADREATRRLARALATLDVRLVEHLVLTRDAVTSMRSLGWL